MPTKKTKPAASAAASTFRDRIVGLIWADPARLRAHPENWRTHPDEQRAAFRGVLDEVGIADAVVAFVASPKARAAMLALETREERAAWLTKYRGPLMLIDGHLRGEMLTQPVPTLVLDVGPEEARKALASHDAVTALAGADASRFYALSEAARWSDSTVQAALACSLTRYAVPLPDLPPAPPQRVTPGDDDEEEPVIPTDALVKKWGTASGQLWVVPSLTVPGREHRLLCGNSRDPASIKQLHEGARPDLGLHDPPYGIDAVGSETGRIRHGGQGGGKAYKAAFPVVEGDREPFDPSSLHRPRRSVLWGANHYADRLPPSAEWIVWVKLDDAAAETSFSSAELAWVTPPADRKGHVRRISCGRHVGGDGDAQRLHPTQKPIAVQQQIVEWYTEPGDLVADWYMGAGAVIIACERTGRIGHGIDIAHAYLAATLERLAARGLAPRRVE